MDAIFKDIEWCTSFLDNILIYDGNTEVEYQAMVENVLQQCVEYGQQVNLLKSEFYLRLSIFLEDVINGQEVKMDPSKLKTLSKWPIHRKKQKIWGFLGLANYYCRFIINYSAKTPPLIDLTKDVPFA